MFITRINKTILILFGVFILSLCFLIISLFFYLSHRYVASDTANKTESTKDTTSNVTKPLSDSDKTYLGNIYNYVASLSQIKKKALNYKYLPLDLTKSYTQIERNESNEGYKPNTDGGKFSYLAEDFHKFAYNAIQTLGMPDSQNTKIFYKALQDYISSNELINSCTLISGDLIIQNLRMSIVFGYDLHFKDHKPYENEGGLTKPTADDNRISSLDYISMDWGNGSLNPCGLTDIINLDKNVVSQINLHQKDETSIYNEWVNQMTKLGNTTDNLLSENSQTNNDSINNLNVYFQSLNATNIQPIEKFNLTENYNLSQQFFTSSQRFILND